MDQWAGHPLSPTPMQSHSAPFWMEQGRGDAGPGSCPGQPGPASSRLTPLALRGVSLSFTLSLAPATRNLLQIRGLALRSHPCVITVSPGDKLRFPACPHPLAYSAAALPVSNKINRCLPGGTATSWRGRHRSLSGQPPGLTRTGGL